ncbi:rhamnose-binding lectin-like isoform X2 [Acanthochromis polyacanthus]|uniref:rhamnose-binding lectin-like isoform X2 n=1 Tax=Acanthochromis polyacanthus TaxID=80966 RepID=UPI0022344966|nr:rhamnose-binding lectin-like isoform X2 [Acanthochromis polyacanthus]
MNSIPLMLMAACLLMTSEPGSCYEKRRVTCEGSVARLYCGERYVISVLRADYGRHDRTICSSGRPASEIQNVHCSRLSGKVAERCNGKHDCSITVSSSVFGDPCIGTYKYLDVTYTCEEPGDGSHEVDTDLVPPGNRSHEVDTDLVPPGNTSHEVDSDLAPPGNRSHEVHSVTCEGAVANLTCGEGLVISVLMADYGRHDRTTCSSGRPASEIQNVHCSRLSGKVAERCNGKHDCSITASSSVFGDPCIGTYKYLDVTYTCEAPRNWSHEVHSVACEGAVAYLKCGEGLIISVLMAVYGRHDRTTCSSGQLAYQIQNVHCSRLSGKVAERCNGKHDCSITASSSVFGDPCFGTYKYLDVTYTCEVPSATTAPAPDTPETQSPGCEGSPPFRWPPMTCSRFLVLLVVGGSVLIGGMLAVVILLLYKLKKKNQKIRNKESARRPRV